MSIPTSYTGLRYFTSYDWAYRHYPSETKLTVTQWVVEGKIVIGPPTNLKPGQTLRVSDQGLYLIVNHIPGTNCTHTWLNNEA